MLLLTHQAFVRLPLASYLQYLSLSGQAVLTEHSPEWVHLRSSDSSQRWVEWDRRNTRLLPELQVLVCKVPQEAPTLVSPLAYRAPPGTSIAKVLDPLIKQVIKTVNL